MPSLRAPADYLVVGAGFFGAVFARLVAEAGRRAVVIDRRPHVAGNCFTERVAGIDVHRYGKSKPCIHARRVEADGHVYRVL